MQSQNFSTIVTYIYIYLFCGQIDRQIIYTIDTHWSDKSSQKVSVLYHKQYSRNLSKSTYEKE